jgi:hypothetical protein
MLYHRLAPAARHVKMLVHVKTFFILFLVEEPRIYQPHNDHAACVRAP